MAKYTVREDTHTLTLEEACQRFHKGQYVCYVEEKRVALLKALSNTHCGFVYVNALINPVIYKHSGLFGSILPMECIEMVHETGRKLFVFETYKEFLQFCAENREGRI